MNRRLSDIQIEAKRHIYEEWSNGKPAYVLMGVGMGKQHLCADLVIDSMLDTFCFFESAVEFHKLMVQKIRDYGLGDVNMAKYGASFRQYAINNPPYNFLEPDASKIITGDTVFIIDSCLSETHAKKIHDYIIEKTVNPKLLCIDHAHNMPGIWVDIEFTVFDNPVETITF